MSEERLISRNQVNKFLSALSTLPQPTSASASRQNSPLRPKALPSSATITPMSSTRDVEAFLKSIPKVKTLGEARRLRVDIERAQRQAQSDMDKEVSMEDGAKVTESDLRRSKKFLKRMERARLEIDAKIRSFTGSGAKVNSSLSRRGRQLIIVRAISRFKPICGRGWSTSKQRHYRPTRCACRSFNTRILARVHGKTRPIQTGAILVDRRGVQRSA